MNPALSQEFFFFCEQEQLQRHATLDKNPYCVYGTLNDFWMTNERDIYSAHTNRMKPITARAVTCFVITVFSRCGYFMSLSKYSVVPSSRLLYLGVICDSQKRGEQRLEAEEHRNGASCYDSSHQTIAMTGATDASPQG